MNYIQRELISKLREWRNSSSRKPLILRGARQVGKSTLVKEFAKEYDVFVYLNLESKQNRELLELTDDVNLFVKNLFVREGIPQNQQNVLIFMDEIQCSRPAVAMLRYFYEERNDIHLIAAGSLLETVMDLRKISFPVGRVQYLALRPCSFVEFMYGMEAFTDAEYVKEQEVLPVIHHRVMQCFKEYTLIGGMPAAVAEYARTRDPLAVADTFESLLQTYKDDVEKYAGTTTLVRTIRSILTNGWKSAAEIISFEGFAGTPYRSREMSEAFQTIAKAMLLELVYPSSSEQLPLLQNFRKHPKLLWLDTGLVNYAAQIQKDVFLLPDIQEVWRGRIAEHIVGQELLALDNRTSATRAFWARNKNNSSAEVDYLLPFEGLAIPIEVKSGHNAKLRSLHLYMDAAPHNVAVRVWSQPYSVDDVTTPGGKSFKLINLPFYYVGQIQKILNKEI